ncbi:4Fe-4S binding protein [Fusobacterium sp. MFO224]|uniref:4Fe-4S binding protein n=1 Tax=Fusobacterium sp. MFO224 TaxID=3378070 RepID=UPI0038524A71
MKKLLKLRWLFQLIFILLATFSLHNGNEKLLKTFIILGMIVLIGPIFCGWMCPFGSVQDFLFNLNEKFFKKKITIPESLNNVLKWLRYVIFFLSGYVVLTLIDSRKNFTFFIKRKPILTTALIMMILFMLLSLFIHRVFCRYFCPLGAKYGLISLTRIFTIKRDLDVCIDCKLCDKNCPMQIQISKDKALNSPNCISCGRCLLSCPKKGALKIGIREFKKPRTYLFMAIGIYFLVITIFFTINKFK